MKKICFLILSVLTFSVAATPSHKEELFGLTLLSTKLSDYELKLKAKGCTIDHEWGDYATDTDLRCFPELKGNGRIYFNFQTFNITTDRPEVDAVAIKIEDDNSAELFKTYLKMLGKKYKKPESLEKWENGIIEAHWTTETMEIRMKHAPSGKWIRIWFYPNDAAKRAFEQRIANEGLEEYQAIIDSL